MSTQDPIQVSFLIIGSGIAGLSLALKLAKKGQVLVIAKGAATESNTWYAQGGIASVFDDTDTFEDHVRDTIEAGAGLCHEKVVRTVVERGPAVVQELISYGAKFTRRDEDAAHQASLEDDTGFPFHLTREGGHSHRRVIHALDVTGREVINVLLARVKAEPSIRIVDNQVAVDLLTSDRFCPDFTGNRCLGAYVMDRRTRDVYQIRSSATFLCTGGHGKIYLYTSNPDTATGDGLAMGWRAGCKVANLEFMQFHPTCLYHPEAKSFLISEAVRGEGGILKDHNGRPFMDDYHPMASLAPRDIVARAIDTELKRSGRSHVFIDVRQLGRERIEAHFPNIMRTCKTYGIDMVDGLLPVVPAAHYSCGGLVTDEWGRTGVQGLYALGEVACTGLHGANRLASNSLLEALVFADRVAIDATQDVAPVDGSIKIPHWDSGRAAVSDELVVLTQAWDEIRRLMWHYVGIVRSDRRLSRAYDRLVALRDELDAYYWDFQLHEDLLEVRNLAQVAWLTTRCARHRKESRGIHYNIDHPTPKDDWVKRDTVLW